MNNSFSNISLPSGYEENTLFLLVQSPRVLYVYWELSPGQRTALAEKGKLQLRLNITGMGSYRRHDIQPFWNNFYFKDVLPGCEYNCEIGVLDDSGDFYPILYSNTAYTPPEKPAGEHDDAGGASGAGDHEPYAGYLENLSSEAFNKK